MKSIWCLWDLGKDLGNVTAEGFRKRFRGKVLEKVFGKGCGEKAKSFCHYRRGEKSFFSLSFRRSAGFCHFEGTKATEKS